MKISVNIETNDPADLIRVGNALAGVMADPTPGAAEKPKAARATTKAEQPAATASAGPQSDALAGASTTTSVSSSATADVAVTEAELTAAANAAATKLGAAGPGKIKDWIAQNFQKTDGSAGTLRLTREDQRRALLRGLQEIGQGVKAI